MSARRLLSTLLLAVAASAAAAGTAAAHPLGNFTVNRLDVVRVSEDRVEVRWILDQAEIPTFQQRAKAPEEVLAAKREEAVRGLQLTVDGERVALTPDGPGAIAATPGQGGLPTTRVELLLSAEVSDPREVVLRDDTFSGRVGWRGMLAAPGEGTAVSSSLPAEEPTERLRRYPTALLESPADDSVLTLAVAPGDGTVSAPSAEGGQIVTSAAADSRSGSDGFAGLFEDAAAGQGVLVLLLLAAFGWGALHAISPGHGKAMVAAYLVGSRGTARHAVLLGGIVTVTHTIGVFALGAVTLLLSQYLLPEDLYPWLNLTAGLLVVLVGALVLRARLRGVPEGHVHGPGGHTHGPAGHSQGPEGHAHDLPGHVQTHTHIDGEHGDAHHHVHTDEHAHDEHGHGHAEDEHHHEHAGHGHHHAPDSLRPRVLLAAGASAGLIPCPSALVVLLAAVAQQQIALGFLLIVVFSLGLAGTLTVLGLIVVQSRRLTTRWRPSGLTARLVAAVPAVSAVIIVMVGVALTASAVPKLA